MKKSSFLAKVFLGYVLLIILTVLSISLFIHIAVSRDSLVDIEEALTRETHLLAEIARPTFEAGDQSKLANTVITLGEKTNIRLTVISLEGVVLADSAKNPEAMENHADRPEIIRAIESGKGRATHFSRTLERDMMYLAMRVDSNGQAVGVVRTALSLAVVNERLLVLRKNVLAGMTVALLLSLPLGYLFARHITKPLAEMTVVAQAIAAGEPYEIPLRGSTDEIGKLAFALEEMSTRLTGRLEKIAQDRSQLEAMLGSMAEGVVAVDRESRIVHLNAAASVLCAVDPGVALGMYTWEAMRIPELDNSLENALARNEQNEQDISIDTTGKTFSLTTTPWRDNSGLVVGAVIVLHDISKMRRVERMRQEFIANASHELKSPLTSIRGFAETIHDDQDLDRATKARFTSSILEECERLTHLVQDMLALSRAESGVQSETFVDLDLRKVIDEVVESHRLRAESNGLQLICQHCEQPLLVMGSSVALVTALGNLLDNAISHTTAPGKISVTSTGEQGEASVSVSDTGVGIKPVHLAKLFERFYRVDNARSRERGGTGLGLAIVKHTAISHGGGVDVDSTFGKGSTFTFKVPLHLES